MTIPDTLTERELIDLNHRIVARLRFLGQMRAHAEMLEFKIGDRVAFQAPGQGAVEGMLTRYNKTTVTVITDDGRQWNVSPRLPPQGRATWRFDRYRIQRRPSRQALMYAAIQ